MVNTMTQRQIEREAEKDLDAAEAAMDAAESDLAMIERRWGLESGFHNLALRHFDRARATHADALRNLERTTHDDPDT